MSSPYDNLPPGTTQADIDKARDEGEPHDVTVKINMIVSRFFDFPVWGELEDGNKYLDEHIRETYKLLGQLFDRRTTDESKLALLHMLECDVDYPDKDRYEVIP